MLPLDIVLIEQFNDLPVFKIRASHRYRKPVGRVQGPKGNVLVGLRRPCLIQGASASIAAFEQRPALGELKDFGFHLRQVLLQILDFLLRIAIEIGVSQPLLQ